MLCFSSQEFLAPPPRLRKYSAIDFGSNHTSRVVKIYKDRPWEGRVDAANLPQCVLTALWIGLPLRSHSERAIICYKLGLTVGSIASTTLHNHSQTLLHLQLTWLTEEEKIEGEEPLEGIMQPLDISTRMPVLDALGPLSLEAQPDSESCLPKHHPDLQLESFFSLSSYPSGPLLKQFCPHNPLC